MADCCEGYQLMDEDYPIARYETVEYVDEKLTSNDRYTSESSSLIIGHTDHQVLPIAGISSNQKYIPSESYDADVDSTMALDVSSLNASHQNDLSFDSTPRLKIRLWQKRGGRLIKYPTQDAKKSLYVSEKQLKSKNYYKKVTKNLGHPLPTTKRSSVDSSRRFGQQHAIVPRPKHCPLIPVDSMNKPNLKDAKVQRLSEDFSDDKMNEAANNKKVNPKILELSPEKLTEGFFIPTKKESLEISSDDELSLSSSKNVPLTLNKRLQDLFESSLEESLETSSNKDLSSVYSEKSYSILQRSEISSLESDDDSPNRKVNKMYGKNRLQMKTIQDSNLRNSLVKVPFHPEFKRRRPVTCAVTKAHQIKDKFCRCDKNKTSNSNVSKARKNCEGSDNTDEVNSSGKGASKRKGSKYRQTLEAPYNMNRKIRSEKRASYSKGSKYLREIRQRDSTRTLTHWEGPIFKDNKISSKSQSANDKKLFRKKGKPSIHFDRMSKASSSIAQSDTLKDKIRSKCPTCHRTYSSRTNCQRHINNSLCSLYKSCLICARVFRNVKSLKYHLILDHGLEYEH